MLAQRLSPEGALKPLLAGLGPVQQEMLLNIAYKDMKKGYNKVPYTEMAEWVDTSEGMVFTFWILLRKKYPQEFESLEKAKKIFNQLPKEEQEDFSRRRNLASGTDTLGNSTGQTQEETTNETSQYPGEE